MKNNEAVIVKLNEKKRRIGRAINNNKYRSVYPKNIQITATIRTSKKEINKTDLTLIGKGESRLFSRERFKFVLLSRCFKG